MPPAGEQIISRLQTREIIYLAIHWSAVDRLCLACYVAILQPTDDELQALEEADKANFAALMQNQP
eukprot:3615402-Amphidinium_carterae.1